MNKEDIEELIKDYISDNLTIEIKYEWDYYQDNPDAIVTLYLNGKEISEAIGRG